MKKWKVKENGKWKMENGKFEDIILLLLKNRGITNKEEIDVFLQPKLEDVTIDSVGIDKKQLKKTLRRLEKAFIKKEQIVVFGDYDVDGITGTAILWETLYALGFHVIPYIPDRVEEGYGLSIRGISNLIAHITNIKLIITVDNGIVANEAVQFANSLGIDVIITDHHVSTDEENKPQALAIVHTTKLCGAGVAWLLSQQITNKTPNNKDVISSGSSAKQNDSGQARMTKYAELQSSHLELATLGTIADLVPLTGANRTIVKFGLEKLRQTKRPGLIALFQEAGIDPTSIGTYEVGFIIAPRLNAAGRIESAMDSLRLLCTKDMRRASDLAFRLGNTNRERQQIMKEATEHAITNYKLQMTNGVTKKIIFIGHESYNPGVIGLVAGKLVEQFYRPAIVLSIGETHAKASVRSIAGVNIIEFLRSLPEMYVNIGGHPMAAGFTVEVGKMELLQSKLEALADTHITDDLLQRSLSIDCELDLSAITPELFLSLQQLAPFGMGNPEPVFATRGVVVDGIKIMGREGKHVRLRIKSQESRIKNNGEKVFEAIGFGMAEIAKDIKVGDSIDIAYSITENTWNGKTKLELRLKDIQVNNTGF